MNFAILPIQVLITIALLWALSRAYLRWREKTVSAGALLFWFGIWSAAIYTVFYPDFTTFVAQVLGIGRGADVVIYGSVIILFYLVFRLHVLLEDIRHDITRLVRDIALQEKKSRPRKQ